MPLSLPAEKFGIIPISQCLAPRKSWSFPRCPPNRFWHGKSWCELEMIEQIICVGSGLIIMPWVSKQCKPRVGEEVEEEEGFLLSQDPCRQRGSFSPTPHLPQRKFCLQEVRTGFLGNSGIGRSRGSPPTPLQCQSPCHSGPTGVFPH